MDTTVLKASHLEQFIAVTVGKCSNKSATLETLNDSNQLHSCIVCL